MVKKPKQDESSEDEEQTYQVEVIKNARVTMTDNGELGWEYRVKWAGYESEQDSWEPADNLQQCERLLRSFWTEIGMDSDDYTVGTVLKPSVAWIEREKAFFNKNFGQEEVPSSSSKRDDAKKPTAGKALKSKAKAKKPGWHYETVSEYEDDGGEDDEPLAAKSPTMTKAAKKTKKTKRTAQEPTSSDSDRPLRKVRRLSKTRDRSASASTTDKGKQKGLKSKPKPKPKPTAASPETDTAPKSDPMDSLFSAPSSPEVTMNDRPLPPSPKASTSNLPTQAAPKSPQTASIEKTAPSTSKAVAATIKAPVPSHKDKAPKVKSLDIPLIDARYAIPTKARLAAGTNMSDAAALLQQQQQKKKDLQGLSFKKKAAEEPSTSNTKAARPTQFPSPRPYFSRQDLIQSPISATGGDWPQSPVEGGGSGADKFSTGSADSFMPQAATPSIRGASNTRRPLPRPNRRPSSQQGPPQTQLSNIQAADEFLASLMPTEMAAPMHEPDGNEPLLVVPAPKPVAAKKITEVKILKKWRWEGELYAETGPGKADRLCNVLMSDETTPRPNGLRINICYTTDISALRLQKFHNVSDVAAILRACGPIQQYCKLLPQSEADVVAVKTLSTWMTRRRQFTYAHVELDKDPVGLLMIYPAALVDICKYFHVPQETQEGTALLAILVPWATTISDFQSADWAMTRDQLRDNGGRLDPELAKKLEGDSRLLKAKFALGLRILRFTLPIYEFISRAPRDYCVWYAGGDEYAHAPGYETKLLIAVLNACRGRDMGYKRDVRVIFVHVGAMKTLYKLEALGMRRNKRPDLRIYSYGTHPSVPPDRWGLREIYPIGGILTFTPLAIARDPFAYELMVRADRHPLWMAYIHPFTIAAVAKITSDGRNPVKLLENGEFFFEKLLQLITDGKLALLHAPPAAPSCRKVDNKPDPTMEWVAWLCKIPFLSRKEILEECLKLLDEHWVKATENTRGKQLLQVVEEAIIRDFGQLQLQPAIMDSYRRFVLVTEDRNDNILEKDAIELTTSTVFTFKDDYYPQDRR